VKSKINLGLDLQGGLYMVLGIDFNQVYRDEMKGYVPKLKYVLEDNGIQSSGGNLDQSDPADPKQEIILANPLDIEKAKAKIKSFFPGYLRLTKEEGTTLQYALTKVIKTKIEEQAVSKSIEVIRNRIDEFGVTEPEITSQGANRIVIQLPGVKDIDRAKSLIGQTAKLTFQMVNDSIPPTTIQDWVKKAGEAGIEFKKGERFSDYVGKLNDFLKNDLPKGHELAFQKEVSKGTNEIINMVPYLLESEVPLSGEQLQDARVQIDQRQNKPYVSLDFKSAGANIFEELTGNNIGRRMAIVLDKNVYSAPNINERIGGGRAQITMGGGGNFNKTMKEARDLALVLRAGALPVQLNFEEQRTVGPSLGHDSIEKARFASLIGAALVFLFILIYYRTAGIIATATLVLNILFVMAFLVSFEATLTLPGIAGIALTVGMAVDANIIIYERIREEVRKGLNYYKAVEAGFDNAFWTIIDANITTALAGICLLNFGTGPIRGFAVTLLIGIISTVYASYFVGRLLFEYYLNKVEGQKLSI
jgi:protein-export membrane protein SecD